MVPMMAVAALVVDVADLQAHRQRLQTGADAAALAIAGDCLRGSCGSPASTASSFAAANIGAGGAATASVTAQTASSVSVLTTETVKNLFGPAIGVNSTTVNASATATWGAPSGGTAALPLAVNACEYNLATGGALPSGTTVRTLNLATTSSGCYAASGIPDSYLNSFFYFQPGGFAWVKTTTGCKTASTNDGEVTLSSGTAVPSTSCTAAYFAALQGSTVLLPVFDSYRQPSILNNTVVYFSVYGYVAFKITGYYFGSGLSWNPACSGTARCLSGYFTRTTDPVAGFTYGGSAAQLGAGALQLSK